MIDIKTIPTAELLADKLDSEKDIELCRKAIDYGILFHKDGLPVQERIDVNYAIIEKISAELKTRGIK